MTEHNSFEKIIAKLEAERKALLSKSYQTDIDVDGDEIDEIQGSLIASISSQLSQRDLQKLIQIDRAFKRMENDTYGSCEDCGDQISSKRLEINPYFSTCISCAEQREMDEQQQRKRF